MAEPQLVGQSLQASLTVKDLDASVRWYTEALGFTESRRIDRDGRLRSVVVQAGDVRIVLNQDDGAKGWERIKGQGMSFQITTTEPIDPIAERIKAHGGTLDTEPTDMPWARIFRVRDPDGFRWTISRAKSG
ncbi:MAG TPA: VOC family protein [Gemmatimonadales bacterium]|nr:VOC family protein [Gemmatimonadales bacterium]